MTIKSLLFSLFLYVSLVWVWAVYRYPSAKARDFALLWTAIGLVVLLFVVLGARVVGWWRSWRAKAASQPKNTPKPGAFVHEDDSEMAALVATADATLAAAAGLEKIRGKSQLAGRPLYLLLGPEGSGKTDTLVNCGLEPLPQLLAGQVTGASGVQPTRLCNIWLLQNAIVAEVSGKVFSGDANRLIELLKILKGKTGLPLWRQIWRGPEHGLELRGVLAFSDCKMFAGKGEPQNLERQSRDWQDRFRAVGEAFGVDFPVYQIITKCDQILYFPDFFRRLPEREAGQVMGCTMSLGVPVSGSSQNAAGGGDIKIITAAFRSLNQSLSTRRLLHLAHEPDPARRPGVYEFPREVKRIRASLIQFLADATRPSSLRPGPQLRGFYFTASRDVEAAAADPAATRANWAPNVQVGVTGLFRVDATQLINAAELNKIASMGRLAVARRWMFVTDLFQKVILADRVIPRILPVTSRVEQLRQVGFAAACGFCALMAFAFCWSWAGNRELLAETSSSVDSRNRTTDLQSLDALRLQVARLNDYDRNGAPISLRWGLYSGDRVTEAARAAYFRRFQLLILNDTNAFLLNRLESLPATPSPNDPSDPYYRYLKTHLIISSGSCPADPLTVSRTLKDAFIQTPLAARLGDRGLADTQIDFFANELPYGNPIRLPENMAVRDHARQYLQGIKGVDKIYNSILSNIESKVPKPKRLNDLAPQYKSVLAGGGDPPAAFTVEGWRLLEKALKDVASAGLGDDCVMGATASGASAQTADVERAIQARFIRDFVDQWRRYLSGFTVSPYGGPEDAARKLEILSGYRSPSLALLFITSKAADFPTPSGEAGSAESPSILDKAISKLPSSARKAAAGIADTRTSDATAAPTPADIVRSFQPVRWVVPPGSEGLINDKNNAYVTALGQLGHSMDEIAHAANPLDPAVHLAANQSFVRALDTVQEIAKGFKSFGADGLDQVVIRLLEQPIRNAKPYIHTGDPTPKLLNGQLLSLCKGLNTTLHKYPFQPSASEEVSLDELSKWFGPSTGDIWKFQGKSLSEFTVKDGSEWKSKDPAKKPQVTTDLVAFLNGAQRISDAFYTPGSSQIRLGYTMRPKMDSKEAILEIEVDGQPHTWTSGLQKAFFWPAPPGTKDPGAIVRVRVGNVTIPVASQGGLWGIFRAMRDAEPRALGAKLVEWKQIRGGNGRLEPISPPARVEIVEFPGNADLFNPKFFETLHCPVSAVQ